MSYNGYYYSLPSCRQGFDSPHLLQTVNSNFFAAVAHASGAAVFEFHFLRRAVRPATARLLSTSHQKFFEFFFKISPNFVIQAAPKNLKALYKGFCFIVPFYGLHELEGTNCDLKFANSSIKSLNITLCPRII